MKTDAQTSRSLKKPHKRVTSRNFRLPILNLLKHRSKRFYKTIREFIQDAESKGDKS